MKGTVKTNCNVFVRQYVIAFLKICLPVFILGISNSFSYSQTPDSYTWSTVASQPFILNEALGKAVNGKLYSFGGFDSQKSPNFTPTKRAYVFDPITNVWSNIADLPHLPNGANYGGVTHAGITTDGNNIYIAGGYTSNNAGTGQIFGTNQVWKYNILQNTYSRLPDLPVNTSAGQLEFNNGKLHLIGGTNTARTLDLGDHYVLDLNNLSGGWSTKASLPNPRHHGGSAVVNGIIYLIGGQHGHDHDLVTQKDVHAYNPVSNTWTKVADLPVPSGTTGRSHITSAVVVKDNKIIVLGGECVHGSNRTNMVSSFDPTTNIWTNLTPLPQSRYSGISGVMNGNLFYSGGSSSSTTYKGTPVISSTTSTVLLPTADAFVRKSTGSVNYGSDTVLLVKSTPTGSYTRSSYLKFSLSGVSAVNSAKLRIYGYNTENSTAINVHAFGVDNDSWTQSGLTWNNAPAASTSMLSTVGVNNVAKFYELDVTAYVKSQYAGDKIVTLLIADTTIQEKLLYFNSKENDRFQPELVIDTKPASSLSFTPESLSYSVVQGGTVSNQSATLTSSEGTPEVNLSKSSNSDWLVLPTSPAAGSLSFGINSAGLAPGTYTSTVTAYASGYNNATLDVSLTVDQVMPTNTVLLPTADAFVRKSTGSVNYGSDTVLLVKSTPTGSFTRSSYLKFSLSGVSAVNSAKLRIYGYNTENSTAINVHAFGVDNDSWTESGLTWNNAPAASTSMLSTVGVNNVAKFYELDVTAYVKSQYAGDKIVTLLIADTTIQEKLLYFNSKENDRFQPELVIDTKPASSLSFTPESLSYSVVQGGTVSNQSATLTSSEGTPEVNLSKSSNSDWLVLPTSPAAGSLSFGINSAGLAPGTYTSTVTAYASGYNNATLNVSLTVTSDANASSILFTQSSQSVEVEQGGTQTLLEYLSTSDSNPTSVKLNAVDAEGQLPNWISVNGAAVNNINYTTGSEISFSFDATNLSIGTYSTKIVASADGYNSGVLEIFLTVKSGTTGTLSNIKVNFQDSTSATPSGWVRDFGQMFGSRNSSSQGTGNIYGWIKKSDNTPLDLTKNGRKRSSPADPLLSTLMHMQGNNISNFSGTKVEGIWEAQVSNGNYDITVSVGDDTQVDSKHYINVEGVPAIVNFVPTASTKFKTATISVTVADGLLSVDATGGFNTKINYIIIQPTTTVRPSVVRLNPENSSQNVSENTSVSTSILNLPNGGINNATITSTSVYLIEESTGIKVPSNVNGTGGGDAITLVPSAPLKLNTNYIFTITDSVRDLSGAPFIPYSSIFRTSSVSSGEIINAKFEKVALPSAAGRHSSLTMGPDGKLYALTIDGIIKRFAIDSDGGLGTPELIYSLQDAYGTRQERLAIGFSFSPNATATNLEAYITHSSFMFLNGPDWDGKLTKLSGTNLQNVQDVLVNLPRSAKDHLSNSIAFGPDGALYFTQGSNSAMGKADKTWNLREEHLLNAAVLRLDLQKMTTLPLDVKTSEGGGNYNPYSTNAPLTIYASGVRNAYDLLWHSNGKLYVPTNGSAAGGNTPASVSGTLRPDGTTYNGPSIPALTNVQQTQKDFLFRVEKGGYYGHPNPLRGEYVMNGGNPTTSIDPAQTDAYPVGTMPDANWRGYSFDFQMNKSPNGVIEYKSNAFNGALKGKLMVVRYSQHDDIITLMPGGPNLDIVSYNEGTSIEGFSGFIDPLDLTEDVKTGNIYVSEYGGEGAIVLLRPKAVANTNIGAITVSPKRIYDNDVAGGAQGINRLVKIKNSGNGVLTVSDISLSGANPGEFVLSNLPTFPSNINAQDSIVFNVAVNPSTVGIKSAVINIRSNDTLTSNVTVSVRTLGTAGLGGTNEPSLQAILDLYKIPVNVGDDDATTNVINSNTTLQKAAILGEEISMQKFVKADSGNVTIEPLAVFGPTSSNPIVGMGWYQSGNANAKNELFTVLNNPVSNGQTVNVNYSGTLSFDPGTTFFGFYSNWPFFNNRHLYSEDSLNNFSGNIPHHVRVYPFKDSNSVQVPNTYIVAFEEHISGFDFQDLVFIVRNVKTANQLSLVYTPLADSYVRNGSYSSNNYGKDTALAVKTNNASTGYTRVSYYKFPMEKASDILSAKLRIYGSNIENSSPITVSSFGVNDNSWTEEGINFNNAPAASTSALSTVVVNNEIKYYELDVTSFVKARYSIDKIATFLIKDAANQNRHLTFTSKESQNNLPQLVITTTGLLPASNAKLFVENLDKFPSNDQFVTSKIFIPWTRDSITYNSNHDTVRVRIHNKGIENLVVKNLVLSNKTNYKFLKLKGVNYDSTMAFPMSIAPGTFVDLTAQFTPPDYATKIKLFVDNLTIVSNDEKEPSKVLYLRGLFQREGEGFKEPTAQEMINAFGYKTKTGFFSKDPDVGDPKRPKGDEIISSYFLKVDSTKPISIRQMGAYHQCCNTQTETIRWHSKGSTTLTGVFTHIAKDAQSLLPRRSSTSGLPAEGTFNPTGAFGFKIGGKDWTDTLKNPGRVIGVRVWRVYDANGYIVPNTYIMANDYLGTEFTNYDYNDNMYYVSNIKPEFGATYSSILASNPSSVDFNEKELGSVNSYKLNIQNLGKTYSDGSSDPSIVISSVLVVGENKSEFSAAMPTKKSLNPQDTTNITIGFNPNTEGLKIADLLVYYNNAKAPLRVPLYGIAKASGTTVTVHNRINSGSSTSTTINGKTWSGDTGFAFDNLEPYSNPLVTSIDATEDDALYTREQSSNGDKKPFRYEIPVANGNYVVRLHFAEIYWGTSGAGSSGGAGSRVMNVSLENELKLINLDVAQEVGSAAAVIKNIPVSVSDGKLNINFTATVNRPMVCAIEVYSFTKASPSSRTVARLINTNREEIKIEEDKNLFSIEETKDGLNDFEKVKIYPNPVKDKFNIEFPVVYKGNVSVQISDLNGRTYDIGKSRLRIGGSIMNVNLSNLNLKPGIYFLKIYNDERSTEVIKLLLD